MAYRLLLLGSRSEQDIVYEDNYSPVTFHEDNSKHSLGDIGQCMIVRACQDPSTFEREFLHGTGLSASDFEMHYVYSAEYLYAPRDQGAFALALGRIMQNTRASDWCINVVFHIAHKERPCTN